MRIDRQVDATLVERGQAVRVLHVFGTMDRGGAETRTLEIMRRVRGIGYQFEFCVLTGEPGAYAAEIERLGGRVLPCTVRRDPRFFARLLALLRAGNYDVVHSHVHYFSGVVLLASRLAGIGRRLAHVHNTHDGYEATPARRAFQRCMRLLIEWTATDVIAVSESAMDEFFGPDWERDPRKQVIYNGVEVARFADAGEAA